MLCKYCGKEMDEQFDYCPHCGKSQKDELENATTSPKKEESVSFLWAILGFFGGLIIILIVWLAMSGENKPKAMKLMWGAFAVRLVLVILYNILLSI